LDGTFLKGRLWQLVELESDWEKGQRREKRFPLRRLLDCTGYSHISWKSFLPVKPGSWKIFYFLNLGKLSFGDL